MTDLIDPQMLRVEPALSSTAIRDAPRPTLVEHDLRPETGAAGPVDRMRSPQVLSPDTLLEASVGRAAVWGAAVGFVLFTVFVGLLGSWGGLNHAGALFLGMFTGFWGGLGFGAMVGGVVALNRAERDALAPEPARPEPA